jgi:hypothetical protein
VVAFNIVSRDVSEDIAGEVLEPAFDADDNLSEDTKRFIDRHVTPGEKRPPAPSLRLSADHALRVGGRKTGAWREKSPGVTGAFEVRTLGGGVGGHRVRTHLTCRLVAPSLGSGERFHEL